MSLTDWIGIGATAIFLLSCVAIGIEIFRCRVLKHPAMQPSRSLRFDGEIECPPRRRGPGSSWSHPPRRASDCATRPRHP